MRLAREAHLGHAGAVDQLLARLEGRLHRWLAARLTRFPEPHELANDLGQEALIRIARAVVRARFHTDGQVVTWALTIGRSVLVDHLRAEGGRRGHADDDVEQAGARAALRDWECARDEPGPAERLLRAVVNETLAPLPEHARELLRLRVHAGATWKDVAGTLQTTEAGAKRRFQRLQAALRRQIVQRLHTLRQEGTPEAGDCLRRLGEPVNPNP